jgi:hypothetical protein
MMGGGDINLIKTRRIGPESVEYAEGFLDRFDKNFMDPVRGASARVGEIKLTNCEGHHN